MHETDHPQGAAPPASGLRWPLSLRWTVLGAVATALLVTAFCGWARSHRHSWRAYVSADGRFSAQFPGRPRIDRRTDALGTPARMCSVEQPQGMSFAVIYFDLPAQDGARPTDDVLLARLDAAATQEGPILATADVQVCGYPAHDTILRSQHLAGQCLRRVVVLARNRVYQVIAGPVAPDGQDAQAQRFIDAFAIRN